MNLDQLITVCKKYKNLGWAIQEQLDSVLIEKIPVLIEEGKLNTNALKYIENFLLDARDLSDEEMFEDEIDDIVAEIQES